jgi:DNA-binding MarR family transcriptional regulator
MNIQDSQEKQLLITLENIKRLTPRPQSSDAVPHGEFVTMFVLHAAMKKQEAEELEGGGKPPGLMVSKLSELLQVSRPTASQMVSTLEDKGYIERVMSATDRRVIYIWLTEKGQTAFGSRMDRYSDALSEIIEKVGREEIDQLILTCARLQEVVNEVRPRLQYSQPTEQQALPDSV